MSQNKAVIESVTAPLVSQLCALSAGTTGGLSPPSRPGGQADGKNPSERDPYIIRQGHWSLHISRSLSLKRQL